VAGAVIGFIVARQWKIETPAIHVHARSAWLSVLTALVIVGLGAMLHRTELFLPHEELVVNCHGATSPGSLEAVWTFEESASGGVLDSSGNGLDGTLVDGSTLSNGIHGTAVRLDGKSGYVDFGRPVNLRFMGSLTIMAWINSASFPTDDAAI